MRDSNTLVQLILDCQRLSPDHIPEERTLLNNLESLTRLMCYKLHLKRLFLYNNIKGVSGNDTAADPT